MCTLFSSSMSWPSQQRAGGASRGPDGCGHEVTHTEIQSNSVAFHPLRRKTLVPLALPQGLLPPPIRFSLTSFSNDQTYHNDVGMPNQSQVRVGRKKQLHMSGRSVTWDIPHCNTTQQCMCITFSGFCFFVGRRRSTGCLFLSLPTTTEEGNTHTQIQRERERWGKSEAHRYHLTVCLSVCQCWGRR